MKKLDPSPETHRDPTAASNVQPIRPMAAGRRNT
jgi:hypothetical protein